MTVGEEQGSSRAVLVGIIGAGGALWGYLHALDRLVPRGYAQEGLICARSRERWPGVLRRRPHARLVSDPAEVLESDAEVLVIVTPPDTHVELAKAALFHGKHVVVEKPLGTTPAEARDLAELARSRRLYLLASPFVHLNPTFRALWTRVRRGDIGDVHSGRALYGNLGSAHAAWYHEGGIGPLAEAGIYNVKSLTAFMGPVRTVYAAQMIALSPRVVAGRRIDPDPDVVHVLMQHQGGALSSVVASHAIWAYRRTAIELYGTEGTANLLGDDWDPRGYEVWRSTSGAWQVHDSIDPTWHWSDGLREIVTTLREGRAPLASLEHDLHVLDVIEAASLSSDSGQPVKVASTYDLPDLTLEESRTGYVHDHTRSPDEQD